MNMFLSKACWNRCNFFPRQFFANFFNSIIKNVHSKIKLKWFNYALDKKKIFEIDMTNTHLKISVYKTKTQLQTQCQQRIYLCFAFSFDRLFEHEKTLTRAKVFYFRNVQRFCKQSVMPKGLLIVYFGNLLGFYLFVCLLVRILSIAKLD